jgi:hypothetical protein
MSGCGTKQPFGTLAPDYGAVVEFQRWPALARGVVGYNLYMAASDKGPWDKVNDIPVTGHLFVPHLDDGKEYYFRYTAVGSKGKESAPTAAFKRKAIDLEAAKARQAEKEKVSHSSAPIR